MEDSRAPGSDQGHQSSHLHYQSSASEWSEALSIGNGRLGAMDYGRTSTELIHLNEDSVWYGGLQDRIPKDALRHLPRLRQLIRDEKHAEAESLVRQAFFATPASMRHYEPLVTCTLELGHTTEDITDYRRHLCLDTAQMTVEYRCRGTSYRRDAIASFPDNVLTFRITASRRAQFMVRLDRVSEIEWETNEFLDSIESSDGYIGLNATPGGRNNNRLSISLKVSCDDAEGSVEAIGNSLIVISSSCTIAIGAQTTYRALDPETAADDDVSKALNLSWDELLRRHRADYQSLFGRVALRMWPSTSHVPTDERIRTRRDPGLVALYHNYGRYLLISSSTSSEKALPATLQGIWNPSFAPPWGCKFTININLQMNYWPAGPCNLVECAIPLLDLLERMAEKGTKTAKAMYGCGGWCVHHNTNIWADTDPQDRWMPSTLWPLEGVWVCIDVLEILQYHHYDENLRRRAAVVLEGCIVFLLDFPVSSACGKYLVTNPSLSPENTFVSKSGEAGILCEGSAIDMTIVQIAFEKKELLCSKVEEALGKLSTPIINANGLIQEWGLKNYEEQEPGHRHVSHLFGLYPGNSINPARSPGLADAAKWVLERRAAHGGGHTGWSRAWLLNLHARLLDAEGCDRHMDMLLKSSTLPNMLDNHPPFQIDGNFGGCAGVLGCLVQSSILPGASKPNTVETRLLPSCPGSWAEGELTRVCTKGGWVVSFVWRNGGLIEPMTVESPATKDAEAHIPPPPCVAPKSKHYIRRQAHVE
ncbi:LOW QUALITY PROTEIN: alpha-L-fucosidase [Colletotrichum cereale]|nr:LOW QUALITY PROTEIN: alpha-L-fucosidase [Colletotrichum cereale]